jgi:hypothetical protein
MNHLVQLLLELLSILERFIAERKQAKRDAQIKNANSDPTAAFNDHFGGVHDDSNKASKARDPRDRD